MAGSFGGTRSLTACAARSGRVPSTYTRNQKLAIYF
jgi:hypothetical protein